MQERPSLVDAVRSIVQGAVEQVRQTLWGPVRRCLSPTSATPHEEFIRLADPNQAASSPYQWLLKHIPAGTYRRNYARRLDNSIYRPLIDEVLTMLKPSKTPEKPLAATRRNR